MDENGAYPDTNGEPDDENVRQVLKRFRDDRSSSRTHEMHKRQLRFAFRILASILLSIALVCAAAVIAPPDVVIARLERLEGTDTFGWMTSLVNTIVGGAIGLALGSYYSQNVGGQ
jgi:hypothetical protein